MEMYNEEPGNSSNFLKSHLWDIWSNQGSVGPSCRRLRNLDGGQEWGDAQGFSATMISVWHVAAAAMSERRRKRGEYSSVGTYLLKGSHRHPPEPGAPLSSKNAEVSFLFTLFSLPRLTLNACRPPQSFPKSAELA